MDDLTNESSFDSKGTWAIYVLGLFFLTCYTLEFHNQALADVRSTGSGIKCLYCMLVSLFKHFSEKRCVCLLMVCVLNQRTTIPYARLMEKREISLWGVIFHHDNKNVQLNHLCTQK